MSKLIGKKAVITGGTSGIGFETAKLFQNEGAKVLVTGRDIEQLLETESSLPECLGVQSDASSIIEIERLADKIKEGFGSFDILFLNAGTAKFAPVQDTGEEFYDSVFDLNTKGLFFTAQKLAPLMNEGGSIVINTSVNNRMGMAGSSVYAASKAAARSFVRTMAAEWIDRGIRVNAVSPGPIETPIFGKLGLPQEQLEEFARDVGNKIPMKRFGKAHEIASAVLFLASDDSSFILGHELVADGGWTSV